MSSLRGPEPMFPVRAEPASAGLAQAFSLG
jgi:hypothetical protein